MTLFRVSACAAAFAGLSACAWFAPPEPTPQPTPVPAAIAAGLAITSTCVGPVCLGMTRAEIDALDELAVEADPAWTGEGTDTFRVVAGGETLARVRFAAPEGGAETVEVVVTASPHARTAEGVGPGTLINDAVALYGPADLFVVLAENHEHAEFEDQPAGLTFQAGARNPYVWRGGVYKGRLRASAYRDDAEIVAVEVRGVEPELRTDDGGDGA